MISTYARGKANPRVDAWLQHVASANLYLSSVTYAELWYGVSRLPFGKRRSEIEAWLQGDLARQFAGQIVGFGIEAARRYGLLLAQAEKRGHTADPLDVMIAAIASAENMTVATLNQKHFEPLGVSTVRF